MTARGGSGFVCESGSGGGVPSGTNGKAIHPFRARVCMCVGMCVPVRRSASGGRRCGGIWSGCGPRATPAAAQKTRSFTAHAAISINIRIGTATSGSITVKRVKTRGRVAMNSVIRLCVIRLCARFPCLTSRARRRYDCGQWSWQQNFHPIHIHRAAHGMFRFGTRRSRDGVAWEGSGRCSSNGCSYSRWSRVRSVVAGLEPLQEASSQRVGLKGGVGCSWRRK